MQKLLSKVLKFLSLSDFDGNLSLTNILLIALVVKIMITGNPDYTEAIALIGCLANYGHKRYVTAKTKTLSSIDFDTLKTQLDQTTKQCQDTADKVSNVIVSANMFRGRVDG